MILVSIFSFDDKEKLEHSIRGYIKNSWKDDGRVFEFHYSTTSQIIEGKEFPSKNKMIINYSCLIIIKLIT